MYGVLDCRFGGFCTKYPTTMYGLCIPDFPWGKYFLFEPLLWHGREGSRAEGYFVQFFVTFGDKERLIIR